MSRSDRWRDKQRQKVKEKMDRSVRAAQIYNELTKKNEEDPSEHHHSRSISRERMLQKFQSCIYYPLVYAGIIAGVLLVVLLVVSLINASFIRESITMKKPVYEVYPQPETQMIQSSVTQGVVSKSDLTLPTVNENYAEIQSDKLGSSSISVFYLGDYEALKMGATQETKDNYVGFPGVTVFYAYHTTYFRSITNLKENDKINIVTSYGHFVYKVVKTEISDKKTSFDSRNNSGNSTVVLYSDEYIGVTGKRTSKFIYVFAELVSGPTVME